MLHPIEGDIVLLKNIKTSISQPILTPPLTAGKKIKLQYDSISHDSIVGKELSSGIVASVKKVQYRVHQPTLAEYTDYSGRIVTPVCFSFVYWGRIAEDDNAMDLEELVHIKNQRTD